MQEFRINKGTLQMAAPQLGLEIISGPMFSNKTTTLISWLREDEKLGKLCLAFKPSMDNRYSEVELSTHGSVKRTYPAIVIAAASEISLHLPTRHADTIGIDEIQFFQYPRNLMDVCRELVKQGKRVILAGLDLNYLKENFAWTYFTKPNDQITELSAICSICGAQAQYSLRTSKSESVIDVGGPEKYQPVCGTCFSQAQLLQRR